ncbi:MAG: MoaD/ThiS family protein [Petrotogales bacterium]
MKIKVKILSEDSTEEIDLKSGSKVYDLLKKIHLRPDTLIVLKDSTPIPVDDTLDDGQELSIINVASGG